ncbi:MAG: NAD(P)/FAD-dependent oxidoreductase [Clostridiaceae bacterium]|nr:NAD(P)/FAD-dependent oxidoreductase [Clostridiaceae bacterium]
MAERIVIVGNGIAGTTAIKAIRETELESEIYLIGDEMFYPYNRIRLSKGIFGELNENTLLLQKKEWYEENRVKLFINIKVLSIDTACEEVLLSNGMKIKYDKLLLSNGSRNSVPPIEGIEKSGVYSLRNLKDALDIKSGLNHSEEIIVIGGGIQGLETAWILQQYGKKVKIIELQDRLMYNQLDHEAGEILKIIIESYGLEILTNTTVKEIVASTGLGVVIDEKIQLQCDMVIYSAGIKPNIELVKNTEIKTSRGILVDNKMQTNIKNIYAAGDIAEFNNQVTGLWNIAILQGKVAGYNISEKETIYENIVPVTTLNAFGISLFSMGRTDEGKSTKILIEEDFNLKQYKKIFISDNRIVGAIVIGDTKKSPLLKSAIEKALSLEDIDLSAISVNELLDKLKK